MSISDDIARLRPAIMAYAMRLVKNADIADDLTQDCLLRMIDRQDQFEPGTSLKAWGFTILARINIDRIRKNRKSPTGVQQEVNRHHASSDGGGDSSDAGFWDADIEMPVPPNQEETILFKEILAHVRNLPPHQAIAVLRASKGEDHAEISELLGVPVGTMRKYLLVGRNAVYQAAFDEVRPRINEPRKPKVSA